MKLRIQGQTVRFRLSAAEVRELAGGGRLEARLGEGGSGWAYGLVEIPGGSIADLKVQIGSGGLTVGLPASALERWAGSEEMGLYGECAGVAVSVEKDQECRHERAG